MADEILSVEDTIQAWKDVASGYEWLLDSTEKDLLECQCLLKSIVFGHTYEREDIRREIVAVLRKQCPDWQGESTVKGESNAHH